MNSIRRAALGALALAGASVFAAAPAANAQTTNFTTDTVIDYELPGYYHALDTHSPFTLEVTTNGVVGEGTIYGANTMLFTGGRSQGPINLNDTARIIVRDGSQVTGTYGSLYANDKSAVAVEGGTVGDIYLTINTTQTVQATANISGGRVSVLDVGKNSAATVSGGYVGSIFVDGAFTVTGGTFGDVNLNAGCVPNLAAGTTFQTLNVGTDTTLTGINAAQMNAVGQVSVVDGTYGALGMNNGSGYDRITLGGAGLVADRIQGQADAVVITGGTFGRGGSGNDAAYLSFNQTVSVSGGAFLSAFHTEYAPRVSVSGGSFTDFVAENGTGFSMTGGAISGTLAVGGRYDLATADISGGTIHDLFLNNNASVTVRGGIISPNTIRTASGVLNARLDFVGADFALVADGTDAGGAFQYLLTGTLQNGDALHTRFVTDVAVGDPGGARLSANGVTLSPVAAPESGTAGLLVAGGLLFVASRRLRSVRA